METSLHKKYAQTAGQRTELQKNEFFLALHPFDVFEILEVRDVQEVAYPGSGEPVVNFSGRGEFLSSPGVKTWPVSLLWPRFNPYLEEKHTV